MSVAVRRAGTDDLDASCAVLADAFSDYPWTRWTVDARDHVQRVEGLQRLAMKNIALPHGEVWVAVDEHDEVVSVAVWSLPTTVVPASVFDKMRASQASLEGCRHDASTAAEAIVARLRPTSAHYYLGAVGTQGAYQGLGFGTAVLRPILDRADAEGADVYLETSAARNVAFYRRLGFVTVDEVVIPGTGPTVWAMLRTQIAEEIDL